MRIAHERLSFFNWQFEKPQHTNDRRRVVEKKKEIKLNNATE